MKNKVERFKFHSIYDVLIPFSLDRIEELASNVPVDPLPSIIDVLEYFNIKKYFEKLIESNIQEKKNYSSRLQDVSKFIYLYFSKISKELIKSNFDDFLIALNKRDEGGFELYQYFDDYIECFEKYKLHNVISDSEFIQITNILKFPLHFFVRTNYFSKFYPLEIETVFFENTLNFKLILQEFIEGHEPIHLPRAINKEKYIKMCGEYIEHEEAHIGCIYLIYTRVKGFNKKYFEIPAKLKSRAKERYQVLINDDSRVYKIKNEGIDIEIFTEYDSYNNSKTKFKSLIELSWLKDNSDNYSLFSYFRTFNYFLTDGMLIGLCSFPQKEMDIFEQISFQKTNHHYPIGTFFGDKNIFVLNTVNHYQHLLNNQFGTSIEEILSYYYNQYTLEKYGVKFLEIEFPKNTLSLKKKTEDLFIIDENIKTQWSLYVENGEIDEKLIEFSSTPKVDELRSLIKDKYYVIGTMKQQQNDFMFLLFSDQSGLNYISKDKKAPNFCELLNMYSVHMTEYSGHQKEKLEFLIKNKIVSLKSDIVYLTVTQMARILIYREIYYFGSYNNDTLGRLHSKEIKEPISSVIREMLTEKLLIGKSTLLTSVESDYFSYVLNNQKFDNALGLRNKYVHGSGPKDNEKDYIHSLLMLVIFALKIDQELIVIKGSI